MNDYPSVSVILGCSDYFGETIVNRLELLEGIPKIAALYELVSINYILKPKDSFYYDSSEKKQYDILAHFCDQSSSTFHFYKSRIRNFDRDHNIIFNRQACLFAIEELIHSNLPDIIDSFADFDSNSFEKLLKYYISVNEEITSIKEDGSDIHDFEHLNPKLLPLNELNIPVNPYFTIYRGVKLLEYFSQLPELQVLLNNYLQERYQMNSDEFIFNIMAMYIVNEQPNSEHNFFYYIQETNVTEQILLNALSSPHIETDMYFKLLNARKNPFFKENDEKYLLIDNILLVEKVCYQFINDFWFDKVKQEPGWNIKKYRSCIGYFFESYIYSILNEIVEGFKYVVLRLFDQLKIRNNDGDEIELADIYWRDGNKVLIGQVKAGAIYDNEKFGGDLPTLYKNDRKLFFKNFGLEQLVNSLRDVEDYYLKVDNKYPIGHARHIYPVILVNDKAFQTVFMNDIFNKRWNELCGEQDFDKKKLTIHRLTLMHISDLERIAATIKKDKNKLWELLKFHTQGSKFIYPFINTINIKDIDKHVPPQIMEYFKNLNNLYNPSKK